MASSSSRSFAGAAEDLREAVLVNPYDPEPSAGASRSASPCHPRNAGAHASTRPPVAMRDVRWWTRAFLDRLAMTSGLDRDAA